MWPLLCFNIFIGGIVKSRILILLTLLLPTLLTFPTYAQDGDTYDPFADYSEFEQASEEEADINFFRNGRFFTLGFLGGYRAFTGILGELYAGSPNFGGYITYFFDLRFAMQLTYLTGNHAFRLRHGTTQINGTVEVQELGFGVKYFLNTQNVTRGLAPINPYLLIGFEQIYRTQRYDGAIGAARDGSMGFAGTFGIEIPMMRNKMYFGAEATYVYVGFPDENNQIIISSTPTGVYPRGDFVRFNGVIGINF